MATYQLNPNRFFDPEPAVRDMAIQLYRQVKDLPIISPHGHVDVRILADNKPFPDPTELILIPDHYIFRMLYSQGIPLESLGIPTIDGTVVESDQRKIWQIFADHFHLFSGTPTGAWLSHELVEVFAVDEKLNGASAMKIYDRLQEKLKAPEFLPRPLFERFKIEVLTSTDGAADSLEHHRRIQKSGWQGRVLPSFRPDAVINISAANWKAELNRLEQVTGRSIHSFKDFIGTLEERRGFFKSMGATSTDQGVVTPYTHKLSVGEAESVFQRALKGEATESDAAIFAGHMLIEMARMSVEDGLVMQIHPGSFRNHNQFIYKRFGPDKGCDIPVATEFTCNLQELLNAYGNDPRLTLIVFTLDESTYARELAPLAGHYPAMKLGPAWWFHDSIEGMTRFRQQVTETAGIYNTVGFNDDTRAFLSIPARHDLSRRIDANFLARLVARHIIDEQDAQRMIFDLAYGLVKKAYKL
jgi:glucuronate isomerase